MRAKQPQQEASLIFIPRLTGAAASFVAVRHGHIPSFHGRLQVLWQSAMEEQAA
jgi:hypothetical protein